MSIACRLAVFGLLAVLGLNVAFADDKRLRAYDGQIIISPDKVPTDADALHTFLQANATKDRRYALIKGPPWDINLVAVLSKEPAAGPVTLVFADAADKKLTPLQSIDVSSKNRLVLAHTSATIAAGFAANKTYVVQIIQKTTTLARAELELRN